LFADQKTEKGAIVANASQLSLTGIVFISFFTLYFCGLGFTLRG
jgi:hypothetical protein